VLSWPLREAAPLREAPGPERGGEK
jgi:hypothetical protein